MIIMYAAINGTEKNKSVYIMQSYRKPDGKTSSLVFRKLGRSDELLGQFSEDQVQMIVWAKQKAKKDTQNYSAKNANVSISLSQTSCIPKDEERCFNVGYLFPQKICTDLRIDNIFRTIRSRHNFTYNFHAILADLIYARILSPSSKLSSFRIKKHYWSHLNILYRMFIVHYRLWLRTLLLFKKNYIVIQILFTRETTKFCITTARITILRLNKKTALNVMEKVKRIVLILS